MRRVAPAVLAFGLLAACASAAPPADACDVELRFGSYGAGVDGALADRVGAAVKDDPDLAGVERTPWGREGEFNLCLAAKPGRDVRAIYQRYRTMLPTTPARGPTTIVGPGGLTEQTPGPR
ncbi:hypothetical protein CSW58_05020 [Caulobacter sp. B11]|uniref:hypothetical protein n=1 Tax=Caulobacter sp. B11 TaxID=2048899 RepID=UPI000C12BBF1|nr:hypothetical protein [Caulobacter sp. B11]PHY13533.1 hypothetical protein CSW58_05020 [Caulobacter sp. B11]